MANMDRETKRLCAKYSAEDARTMKSLRSIVQTALLQLIEIEQQTLAKEADRPPKGTMWVKVFLGGNVETTYDDGSVTCDDADKQVCCTGQCPC